jgi:hypothetical protein
MRMRKKRRRKRTEQRECYKKRKQKSKGWKRRRLNLQSVIIVICDIKNVMGTVRHGLVKAVKC